MIMAALVRPGRGPRHTSAYGCSSKNFLSFALVLFAQGIWCIISVDLVPGSHCSLRLVLRRSAENWISREMSISVGAMLGSTVDTCYASVLGWLWMNFTLFLRCGRLESSSVPLPTVAERRSVPSRCFWLQFCFAQFALGKLDTTFTSFTWLTRVTMERIFRRSVRHFSASC